MTSSPPSPPEPFTFLTTLLPLIFTSSPSALPPTLLSKPTRLAHKFLSPEVGSSSYYCLSSREEYDVERLRETIVTESYGEMNLGKTEWEYDKEEREVKARVAVGKQGLCVIMVWEEAENSTLKTPRPDDDIPATPTSPSISIEAEEEDDDRPAWTFLTLSLLGPTSPFKPTLQAAISYSTSNRPSAIDIPNSKTKKKEIGEMAQGEGTTPGAYGAAEDFWQGWSDDEGAAAEANSSGRKSRDEVMKDANGTADDDADDYWGRYGEVEPVADSGREGRSEERSVFESGTTAAGTTTITRSRRSSTIRPPLRSPHSASPSPSPSPSQSPSRASFPIDTDSSPPPLLSTETTIISNGSSHLSSPTNAFHDAGIKTPPSPPLQPTLYSAFPSALNLADDGTSPTFANFSDILQGNVNGTRNGINKGVGMAPGKNGKTTSLGFHINDNEDDDDDTDINSGSYDFLSPQSQQPFPHALSSTSIESPEDESLRFALAGLWQLYSGSRTGGGGGDEMEKKRETWRRIASMVTRS